MRFLRPVNDAHSPARNFFENFVLGDPPVTQAGFNAGKHFAKGFLP
jgi:hypothetical protein